MLIILLVTLIKGQVNWVNYSFDQPQRVALTADETIFSKSLDEFGQILNHSIVHEGTEAICFFDYQYQYFRGMSDSMLTLVNTVTDDNIDNVKTEDIENGFNEEIVANVFNGKSVMLLQNNGILHEIYIGNYSEYLSSFTYNLTFSSEMKNSPQLLYENGAYYYVEGGELIKFIIKDSQIYQFPFTNWEQIYGNFKMTLKNDFIYIINGRSGLKIYKIEEHHQLSFLQQIEAYDLYGTSSAMNLVDQIIVNDFLYILDSENGVIRFNISSQKIDKYFFIPQTGQVIMTIRNSTIMLSHSSQVRSTTIEGVITENSWQIIRKFTMPKQLIKKIMLFDDYAILISQSKGHIYQTKLLENYTDPLLVQGENFYSQSLLDLYELDDDVALGVFISGIAVFYRFELPAWLFCSASVAGLNKVIIQITSTDCQTKNSTSELTFCQSYLQYEFDVQETLMSPQAQDVYIYMCGVSAAIVVALLVSIFLHYRRYKIKKELIDERKKQKLQKRKL